MNLAAVKDAPPPDLARGAVAAAKNACGLVQDAELLSDAGRRARAYSLAGLAVEEVGKADNLVTLAAMPENLRAQAPVGRMLEWHQMKLITGQLTAAIPYSPPGMAARFATMPLSEVAVDTRHSAARNRRSACHPHVLCEHGYHREIDALLESSPAPDHPILPSAAQRLAHAAARADKR
jgi:AbiV family abortive infection protein